MSKEKTLLEELSGKLISAIQKEWGEELGEESATESEEIMHKAHEILQAVKKDNISYLLSGKSVAEYIGLDWVENHPKIKSYIDSLEAELS